MNFDLAQDASKGSQPVRGGGAILFARSCAIQPFVDFAQQIGAPAESWLHLAGLPDTRLLDPEGLVSLPACYRFIEVLARKEHLEDLGLILGRQVSAFDLGAFGIALREAPTVYDYLRTGVRSVETLSCRGTRFWLTTEGDALRVNQHLAGPHGLGMSIADAYTLVLTIHMVRRMIGPDWWPREIRLRAGGETLLVSWEERAQGALVTGQPHSSFTLSRSLLTRPVTNTGVKTRKSPTAYTGPPMPEDFIDSIEQIIMSMLPDGRTDIGSISAAAGMSARTLQRRLAESATTYSGLLTTCRMRQAQSWLSEADMPVAAIANELGYTDASNFARAFQRENGVSPLNYRRSRAVA